MNHIQALQTDRATLRACILATRAAIQDFRVHLSGPKFRQSEHDGERRDWIAIGDVFAWLRAIETELGD